MDKYKIENIVSINKSFQKSVNLVLDIDNEDKVKNYIPTRSSIRILGDYIKSATDENGIKSNILIGPYGKGKSHLLLVLLSILSHHNKKGIKSVLKKIKDIDENVYNVAKNYINCEKPYLPIIVATSGEELNKAFLYALNEALVRVGLDNISPKSYYSEAYKAIMNWKGHYADTYKAFENIIYKKGIKTEDFIKRLNNYDDRILSIFREIYPMLTSGSEFNPLVTSDVLKIYKETNTLLCEKYGYAGMYIIFDEFSKFIEDHNKNTFATDMAIVQNICELANNSKKEKIRTVFVAHKSIKQYGKKMDKEVIDAFKGVEGRLTETLFVISSQNNYEMIKDAIQKKNTEQLEILLEKTKIKEIIEKTYQIPCFKEIFNYEDYKEMLVKGCYPLTPITAYLLLNISEKIAQNERTVFTFISGNENNSLINKIRECDEKNENFVGADAIFDYFDILFKQDNSMPKIHNEYIKAEYALSRAKDKIEQKIIKVIALIKMNGREEELVANRDNIAASLMLDKDICVNTIKELEKRQIIVFRQRIQSYTFTNNVGLDLENEINNAIGKIRITSLSEAIQQVSQLKYILPKKYNQTYTMTRYYQYEYMTYKEFLAIKNFDIIFEKGFSDGKIIAVINEEKPDYEEIREKTKALNDKRIIVVCPNEKFDKIEQLKKYLAVKNMLKDKEFLENNKVLEQELLLYEDDLAYEINERLLLDYKIYEQNQKIFYMGKEEKCSDLKEFNKLVSKICNKYYNYAPKINNELINKHNVTVQIAKSRNVIVNELLKGADFSKYQKGTSAEATIYRAALINTKLDTGVEKVTEIITEFVNRCSGEKRNFKELYDILLGEKYGTRKGVIPIYIANVLSKLEDMPVVYLADTEIEIDAKILGNINDNPNDYYLFVEKENANKTEYIENLQRLFLENVENIEEDKGKRVIEIAVAMQSWYRALPQYSTTYSLENSINKEMISMIRKTLKKIEINPRELLFDVLPNMYQGDMKYENCYLALLQAKIEMEQFVEKLKEDVVKTTKDIFKIAKEDNLKTGMSMWYEKQSNSAKEYLYNETTMEFMNYLLKIDTYDEFIIINRMAKNVVDLYVEDWKDETYDEYKKRLIEIKREVEEIKENTTSENMNRLIFTSSDGKNIERYYEANEEDAISYFLKNAIEETIDEFGGSLETNQKIAVLVKTIEQLLGK